MFIQGKICLKYLSILEIKTSNFEKKKIKSEIIFRRLHDMILLYDKLKKIAKAV